MDGSGIILKREFVAKPGKVVRTSLGVVEIG